MWILLLLWSWISIGSAEIVSGHRGQTIHIRCSYESKYKYNSKYFCKGPCLIPGLRKIMVRSGFPASDERFSLSDDRTAGVFTVTITDLRAEDGGQYWCSVKKLFAIDVYSEILLLVKEDEELEDSNIGLVSDPDSWVSSAPLVHPSALPQTSPPVAGSLVVILVTTGVLVLLLTGIVLLVVAVRKKMFCGGLISSSAGGIHLMLRSTEENEYEDGDPTASASDHRDTDLHHTSTLSSDSLILDQIYTELNRGEQMDVYQSLTADSSPTSD